MGQRAPRDDDLPTEGVESPERPGMGKQIRAEANEIGFLSRYIEQDMSRRRE